jgi:hypothetical protein
MFSVGPSDELCFPGMRVANYESLRVNYKIFVVLESDFQDGGDLLR